MEISQSFSKYGWDFELYKSERISDYTKSKRKRYKAIYIGRRPGLNFTNIEIVILIEREPDEYSKKGGYWLRYPSTSEWGKIAWTCTTLERALKRYNQIS